MVFPTSFNLSLILTIRSSWYEPQSAPSLVFADSIELLHLCLQRIQSIWFYYWPSGDDHVCSLPLCCWKRVLAMTRVFSCQNSLSLCPASFCASRPNLPVTPDISWFPTFSFQSPIVKRTFFVCVLVLDCLVGHIISALDISEVWILKHWNFCLILFFNFQFS